MKSKIIIILLYFFSNITFGQTVPKINSDWNDLKKAVHQIGFCVFHSNQKICAEHKNELTEREKTAPADMEVYYFEMKKEWAQNRLNKWSERQAQPAEDFIILFDVAQYKPSEKSETETFNLFRGFVLIDLTDTIDFAFHKKDLNQSMMSIESEGKNALMENVLWREFMTGRLGRFSQKIDFKLLGKNAEADFEKFKEAFLFFQKEKF
ncbi:MAG: hypothetical protein AB8F94_15085 [Saprospiraceae bacterium]